MQIFVNTPTSKQVILEIEPTDLIENIRAIIGEKVRCPIDTFRLYLLGKLLEDGHSLQYYSIQNDTHIRMIFPPCGYSGYKIHVESFTGKTFTLNYDPIDHIADIKAMIEDID